MKFQKTKIRDLYILDPEPIIDERGDFQRIFCQEELAQQGINFDIHQVSQSLTKQKGTIRGLHFQKEPRAEDKIVRCIKGAIYDVVVDLRPGSSTYGEWIDQELSEENKKMLLIPKGFAHGFQVLIDNSVVQYFISEFYSPEHANGIPYNDSSLNIPWPIKNPILSEKDKNWPPLKK